VESRAQAQILPRLQPRTFNDIIVSISLIRPGPVQGNMVHPYLRRRVGEEEVTYPHPLLEDSLGETLGVVLFQEQVLKVTRDLAGFTPGQGELLRRALGSKNPQEAIKPFYEVFVEGALMRGVQREIVEEVWATLRAFAGYSFPKSHAAAFAVLVYQSAWLKYYYPAAFYVALLNNQPMGFWTPAVVVNDARRHEIEVLGVDIHQSDAICTVIDEQTIRLGFNYIDRMGEQASQRLLEARQRKEFTDLKDFCLRTQLPRNIIENLILVGAMDAWGTAPRQLLWSFGKLDYQAETLDLIYADDGIRLPDVTPRETLYTEYDILGVALDTHPMSFYQDWLSDNNILTSHTLPAVEDKRVVRVAGLLVVRQSPHTAKGVTFLTLEDEDGFVNVIVHPHTLEKYQRLLRNVHLLMVEGKLQREKDVINIVATHIHPLPRL
jgi:error-prone DNA polymerase